MAISKRNFGFTKGGVSIDEYILSNQAGMEVSVLTYGATIRKLIVPNNNGKLVDVVLGFETLAEYESNHPYIGSIIGRNANRIGKGNLEIQGKSYTLSQNENSNQLHGGFDGFNRKVWKASVINEILKLQYTSPDGEEGFPGTLSVTTTFQLKDKTLEISFEATTDKTTVVNLTRHEYFNLAQEKGENIQQHHLAIYAKRFTPVNREGLPSGEVRTVFNTPYDFSEPKRIGDGQSYDLNYVLDNGVSKKPRLAAHFWSPSKDLRLSLFCTQPGLQFFSANALGSFNGKYGMMPATSPGLCLEPQYFPDALKHPHFPSTLLTTGSIYTEMIKYCFE